MKEAAELTSEIKTLVAEWEGRLQELPDDVITIRRNSQSRNIKQILGHLIDSTSNNTHRIVHLQYQPSPFEFPNYASLGNNDRWIAIQNYHEETWSDMILLWKYSLIHLCHVINNIGDDKLMNEWIAGPGRLISLESMTVDFNRHLKLHLSEIEDLIAGE